jgi:hypothetical protein
MKPYQLVGDVNGDCRVNVFDLAPVAGIFGSTVGPSVDPYTDVDLDGKINVFDLVLVASNFGATCS